MCLRWPQFFLLASLNISCFILSSTPLVLASINTVYSTSAPWFFKNFLLKHSRLWSISHSVPLYSYHQNMGYLYLTHMVWKRQQKTEKTFAKYEEEPLAMEEKYLLHVKQTLTGKGTRPLWSNSCCVFFTFFPVVSSFLLLLLEPRREIGGAEFSLDGEFLVRDMETTVSPRNRS